MSERIPIRDALNVAARASARGWSTLTAHQSHPLGSWLLGSPGERPSAVRVRVRVLAAGLAIIVSGAGFGIASIVAIFVVPGPSVFEPRFFAVTWIALPIFVVSMMVIGTAVGLTWTARQLDGALARQDFNERQRRLTLNLPALVTAVMAVCWLLGGALFTLLYGLRQQEIIPKIAFSALFSGVVTCGAFFLLCEFAMRPLAARALLEGAPERKVVFGVTVRTLGFWWIGTGLPVSGMMIIAGSELHRTDVSTSGLAVSLITLCALILLTGSVVNFLATRATKAPLNTVRAALARVERGDLDTHVVVFDGTELGQLQASVNHMVAGLRERERLKKLFGQHVGEDVAEAALSADAGADVELGGEVRDVAVLFVDVVGSTRIAATRPPTEVVAVLNRFFSVVVEEVHAHEGFVNKFQGDAALAIFGAPVDLPDARGRALAAARSMIERLAEEVPEFSAGIGVSAGPAVAGNVGAESRFEYTVIGDPVNEAARLTELAKTVPGHVAVSMNAVDRACPGECAHWQEYKKVSLRGRLVRTRVGIRRGIEQRP